MINVTRNGYSITIQGHSNAAPKGEDLVCAATSILAYTLAENVKSAMRAGIARRVEIVLEDGIGVIRCRPCRGWDATLSLIFDTVSRGFAILAQNEPEKIFYKWRGAE